MSGDPNPSGRPVQERSEFDRRQFLTASGVVGASFLAGAGTTAAVTNCVGLPLLGGGGTSDPIKLGAVYLRFDPAGRLGPSSAAEAQIAVRAVNESGGIDGRDVELVLAVDEGVIESTGIDDRDVIDDEIVELVLRDESSTHVDAIEALVEEFEVDALLGLSTAADALAAGPRIEELGVPFALTDVGTPFITEHDADTYGDYYEPESGKAAVRSNVFRTGANTSINTYAMATFARENLDVTRVANLGPDTLYGRQAWDYFRAYADGLGADYEYVASEFPALGTSDMTAGIDAVVDADPDLVFTSFWAGDAVTFVEQAVERGLFDRANDVFDTLGADPRVFKALGDAMPEGVHYSAWYWYSAFDNEHNDEFIDDWKGQYYRPVWHDDENKVINAAGPTGGSAWAAVFLYKQAMEAADGTDPEAVVAELEGASFEEDPRGSTTVDPKSHQANAPVVIGETSTNDDVFYRTDIGLDPTETYTLDRSTATSLLEGSGLPPGV